MKKIFKEGGMFYIAPGTTNGLDAGKPYTERGISNYLINHAPEIDIDTRALSGHDKQIIIGAYHKGLKIFTKKHFGV